MHDAEMRELPNSVNSPASKLWKTLYCYGGGGDRPDADDRDRPLMGGRAGSLQISCSSFLRLLAGRIGNRWQVISLGNDAAKAVARNEDGAPGRRCFTRARRCPIQWTSRRWPSCSIYSIAQSQRRNSKSCLPPFYYSPGL